MFASEQKHDLQKPNPGELKLLVRLQNINLSRMGDRGLEIRGKFSDFVFWEFSVL